MFSLVCIVFPSGFLKFEIGPPQRSVSGVFDNFRRNGSHGNLSSVTVSFLKESSDNQRLLALLHSLLSLSLYLPHSYILSRFIPFFFERIKIASLHHLLAEREEA